MKAKTKYLTLFAGAVLLWPVLVMMQLVGGMNSFDLLGLLNLPIMVSIPGFFVMAVICLIARRWRQALYSGLLFLYVSSSMVGADFIWHRQKTASMVAAQYIIAAAERFHSDTDSYPKSLSDLIPAYLPTEPHSMMGFSEAPFRFRLSTNADHFYISFALPHWMSYYYDSESKRWSIKD